MHLTKTQLKMFGCKEKIFCERHFYENKTFQQVKQSFFNFPNKNVFNFKKSSWQQFPL